MAWQEACVGWIAFVLVTIIADASFCPETKAAGYGYWVISQRGRNGGGGSFKNKLDSASAAEMMAVVNAIYFAMKTNVALACDELLIQTDCMAAIDAFLKRRERLTKDETAALGVFSKIKARMNLKVSFRHVRGHTRVQDARSITNRLCDSRAKKGMREVRNQILKEKEVA